MKETRVTRRQLLQMMGGASAAAILAACTSPAPTQPPAETPGSTQPTGVPTTAPVSSGRPKEFRLIAGNLTTLDTYLYTPGMYTQTAAGIKEGLMEFGPDFSPQPAQAESWETSADGMEYTFHLRRDNVWYDGTPVTAHDYVTAIHNQGAPGRDSKWSWDSPFRDLVNGRAYNSGSAAAEDVGVEAVDDYTVKYTLARRRPDFLAALMTGNGYPLHTASVEQYPDTWMQPANFQGNGPYMVDKWVENEYVTLVPNPNYNRERGNLAKITIRFAGRGLEAYEAGEIDYNNLGSPADVTVARNDPTLQNELGMSPTTGQEYMTPLRTENSWLWDHQPAVKAFIKAVDMKAIADPIWLGLKEISYQLGYDLQPGYDASLDELLKPNVDEARQILADLGFPNGQGVPKLKWVFPSSHNQDYVSTYTAIVAELRKNLGVEFELNNAEQGIYAEVAYADMNPPAWDGLVVKGAGRPWRDPLFATEYWDNFWSWESTAALEGWGNIRNERRDIRNGTKVVPGGSDDDFANLIAEMERLANEALASIDAGNHYATVRNGVEADFTAWINQAKSYAEAAKTGDRAASWKEANLQLSEAKIQHYESVYFTPSQWRLLDLRGEMRDTVDETRLAEMARECFTIYSEGAYVWPLWRTAVVYNVKPYVQGFKVNPFWWGGPAYLKWVDIV